jgi:hypothetical protein
MLKMPEYHIELSGVLTSYGLISRNSNTRDQMLQSRLEIPCQSYQVQGHVLELYVLQWRPTPQMPHIPFAPYWVTSS